MSYRNERFNRSMFPLEAMTADMKDASKARIFSENGEGVERMVTALDYDEAAETTAEERVQATIEDKLFEAKMRLVDAGKGYLIRVLRLIVENGNDREESMRHVAKRTYFRHRNELIRFFSQPQPSTTT